MEEFREMVVVVTGAGSGIGKAIAIRLAVAGANVYLIDRDSYGLDIVSQEIKTTSNRVMCYQKDLSKVSELKELSRELTHDLKKIDILVHSAGFISRSRFEKSSMKDFDQTFSVNVRAAYYLTQRLLPLLRQSHGQIVFINSSVALRAASGKLSQYTMSKYALRALADSLRDEINSAGIRVISIYPGRTATPMQKKIHLLEGKKYEPESLLRPEDVAQSIISILALPRTAEITDVSIRSSIKPTC